jgi:hypothetical protein
MNTINISAIGRIVTNIKHVNDQQFKFKIYQYITVIQFNSVLYYLCAESTAVRPITDTAQCT